MIDSIPRCEYCRNEFSEKFRAIPDKGIKTMFKKRGIVVRTPICHPCSTKFSMARDVTAKTDTLFVRHQLRQSTIAVTGDEWEQHEGTITDALRLAEVEIAGIDAQIKVLLDKVQDFTSSRNDIFSKAFELKDQLFRRESKTYKARRKEADRVISDPVVRDRIFKRDGFTCCHCRSIDFLSIDHKIPVFHGGGNEDDNLMTLCTPCNSRKGAKLLEEITKAIEMEGF